MKVADTAYTKWLGRRVLLGGVAVAWCSAHLALGTLLLDVVVAFTSTMWRKSSRVASDSYDAMRSNMHDETVAATLKLHLLRLAAPARRCMDTRLVLPGGRSCSEFVLVCLRVQIATVFLHPVAPTLCRIVF